MKASRLSMLAAGSGLLAAVSLIAVPAFAQTAATKQSTQDGNSPTTVGPASKAFKQQTQDGNSPTMVGPASKAFKQQTETVLQDASPVGAAKQH